MEEGEWRGLMTAVVQSSFTCALVEVGQRKLVRKSVCDGVTLRLCFRDTTLLENPIVVGMGLWYRVQGALRFLQRLDVEVRYLGCETSSLAFDLEDPKSVKRLRRFSQAMPLMVG